jgi:hypothetical protein
MLKNEEHKGRPRSRSLGTQRVVARVPSRERFIENETGILSAWITVVAGGQPNVAIVSSKHWIQGSQPFGFIGLSRWRALPGTGGESHVPRP